MGVLHLPPPKPRPIIFCVDRSAEVVSWGEFMLLRRVKEVRKKIDLVGVMLGRGKGETL